MTLQLTATTRADANDLAELRLLAMRDSLEAVGRFEPSRARQRFLASFNPANTRKLLIDHRLAAFLVVLDKGDHFYLDHLYVHPDFQAQQLGSRLLEFVKAQARSAGKAIRLGALTGSRANHFYLAHGFIETHREAFDNYYQWLPN
ncbi:GNAT family N-acetyltransferase [Halioxenophilus sp. WMMB6]|uniref:GNAT family N-acetyltransferase n=1 Tax=Halioxenophilus sp. WMMB6 TaxID=3073815 RepID=UPI00295EB4EF|nr:GNAT family N-acetyltransferase [Halioxenophilus sp. WMMB6]